MTEKDYRAYDAYNYSLLAASSKGLQALRGYFKVNVTEREMEVQRTKPFFRMGSALDSLLFPTGEKNFVVSDEQFEATNQEYILVEAWLAAGNTEFNATEMELFSRDLVYEVKGEQKVGLWSNIKDPTKRLAKVEDSKTKSIFKYLTEYKDKTFVSNKEFEQIIAQLEQLKSHPNTAYIFEEKEGVEHLHQYPIIVPYTLHDGTEVEYKVLLDLLVVDHNTRIIKPYDGKTKGEPAGQGFAESYLRFRYIYQDALYTEVVKKWAAEKYPTYHVEPLTFIVTHWDVGEPPLLFRATDEVRTVGLVGGQILGYKLRGVLQETVYLKSQMDSGQLFLTPDQTKEIADKGYLSIDFDYVNVEDQSEAIFGIDDIGEILPDFSLMF